jgi:hypothetical protein
MVCAHASARKIVAGSSPHISQSLAAWASKQSHKIEERSEIVTRLIPLLQKELGANPRFFSPANI